MTCGPSQCEEMSIGSHSTHDRLNKTKLAYYFSTDPVIPRFYLNTKARILFIAN